MKFRKNSKNVFATNIPNLFLSFFGWKKTYLLWYKVQIKSSGRSEQKNHIKCWQFSLGITLPILWCWFFSLLLFSFCSSFGALFCVVKRIIWNDEILWMYGIDSKLYVRADFELHIHHRIVLRIPTTSPMRYTQIEHGPEPQRTH